MGAEGGRDGGSEQGREGVGTGGGEGGREGTWVRTGGERLGGGREGE